MFPPYLSGFGPGAILVLWDREMVRGSFVESLFIPYTDSETQTGLSLAAEFQQCDTRSNKNIINTAELTIYTLYCVRSITEHGKSKRKSKEEHA